MAQRSSKGSFDPDVEVPAFAQRVLDLVDAIPAGKVLAYGDIAEYLGEGGPRQVGSVMSTWGGAVPWHRVVHADGTPAPSHDGEVLRLLRADVTPMRGDRVDMRQARWNPDS
ncbi:MAG TPA: MGMT family protein [Acidothermaceae bacterium]|nr:MGMT family protein [Acidothermaceae bacterium]